MSENKVNSPEDSIRKRDDQTAATRENQRDHKMLSRLVCGVGRCSQFMENCEACVLAETRCNTEERDKKFQVHCVDVRDVEVVCDMCCSSLGRRAGRMEAAARGIDGSCQLHVSMTQLLQKHWEWRTGGTCGTAAKRATMYLASMDSKTAFDVAGPKQIARSMGDQAVHGLQRLCCARWQAWKVSSTFRTC